LPANMAQPPLHGITVLDLCAIVAGPMVSAQLAEMGAEVLKLEPANGIGDVYRVSGTHLLLPSNEKIMGSKALGEKLGASFAVCNRGKRSIAVDSKSAEGREIIEALVRKADVLVINQRPKAVKGQNLGYEALSAINPGLIYCGMNGFGSTGPLANDKAYDVVVQAMSGTIAAMGRPTTQEKKIVLPNNIIMDKVTAMTAVQSILAALFARTNHPERHGQQIELSMLDTGLAFNWCDVFGNEVFIKDSVKDGVTLNETALVPEMFGVAKTLDNEYVTLYAFGDMPPKFAKAFDCPEVTSIEWIKAQLPKERVIAIRDKIVETIAKHTTEEVLKRFKKFDLAGAVVLDVGPEAYESPQALHNKTVVTVPTEHASMRLARPAPILHATPLRVAHPPPLYGQHTDIVLKELGYDDDKIAQLRKSGVVRGNTVSKL